MACFHAGSRRTSRSWFAVSSACSMQQPGLPTRMAPPGNRLVALTGDLRGQWSIRINDQWRICFRWHDGDAYEVQIVDYH